MTDKQVDMLGRALITAACAGVATWAHRKFDASIPDTVRQLVRELYEKPTNQEQP